MIRNGTVSAIIPTRNRPHLVVRAVESALSQTYNDLEVIVVIDGPDPATTTALGRITDPRLRVLSLSESLGAQRARNTGIEAAVGDWIALLDDDDEWLPEKISIQVQHALRSPARYPLISCKFHVRSSSYQLVWPRRLPYEPLSEYLLARDSLSMGEGVISTITLLFPKDLSQRVPFSPSLRRCHDVDWLLRVTSTDGVAIHFVPAPLAIAHHSDDEPRITNVPDWHTSLEWVESVRHMITGRAYASYLAITVASQAARKRDWMAFPVLLSKILRNGAPKVRDLAFFLSVWCVPRSIQLAVRKAGL